MHTYMYIIFISSCRESVLSMYPPKQFRGISSKFQLPQCFSVSTSSLPLTNSSWHLDALVLFRMRMWIQRLMDLPNGFSTTNWRKIPARVNNSFNHNLSERARRITATTFSFQSSKIAGAIESILRLALILIFKPALCFIHLAPKKKTNFNLRLDGTQK